MSSAIPPAGLSPQSSPGWQGFTSRLSGTLASLEEGQFLLLEVRHASLCVQFMARGPAGMRAEAVSHHDLHGKEKLRRNQMKQLLAIGWMAPTGSPTRSGAKQDPHGTRNHFVDFPSPVPFDRVAALAGTTLADVLQVPHPGFLRYKAWTRQGAALTLPGLGLEPCVTAAPEAIRAPTPKELLLLALRRLTGSEDIDYDRDGDIPLRTGSAVAYVRLVSAPPYVRVFSILARDVQESPDILGRLNHLNAILGHLHVYHWRDTIVAMTEFPAAPLVQEHIEIELTEFLQATRLLAAALQPHVVDRGTPGGPPATREGIHEHRDPVSGQSAHYVQTEAGMKDLPGALQRLRKANIDSSWIVFIYTTERTSDRTEDREVAIQYSVDDGVLGMDWVLLAPRNVADQALVTSFIQARAHAVREMALNGVRYLRVEDGDLEALGIDILTTLYGASPLAEVGFVFSGIEFPMGWQWND